MRLQFLKVAVLSVLFFLVSCGQPPSAIVPESGIVIRTGDLVENQIPKESFYNECLSGTPTNITLTYGQVLSESFSKELTLGLSGVLEAGIPATVKASIEAEVKERFLSEKKMILESTQAASFSVPANTKLKVIILLKETLREGIVSYLYNGQTFETGYSYRINLEVVGLEKETIPCSGTAMPTCENGFDAQIWAPVTTNPNKSPKNVSGCWQLQSFGMSMANETISFLESEWDAKARWYGVTRSIPLDAKIRLDVDLAQLVEGQIWIGFSNSPDSINYGKFLIIKPADITASGHFLNAFSLVEMKGGVPQKMYDNVFVPYDTGKYSISLEIEMNRLLIWLNSGPKPSFPVVDVYESYLFIGYLAPIGIQIDGTISNVQIEP